MHTTSRLIIFSCLLFSWTDNIYSWEWSDVTNIAQQARVFLAYNVVPKSTPFIGLNASICGRFALNLEAVDSGAQFQNESNIEEAQVNQEIDSKLKQIRELQEILHPLTPNVAKKDEAQSLLDTLKAAENNIQDYATAVSSNLLHKNHLPSLYIPQTQDLNKLAARIHALSDTTDLSLLAHVVQAQENISDLFTDRTDTIGCLLNPMYKRIAGNILGSGRYVKALAAPQHGQDVVVGVVGSLTAMGLLSLSLKEPGAGMTLGSMTTGFAGAIACKRLLSQSFHKRLEDIEIRQIDTEFKSHHDRLTNLMQNLNYQVAIASIGSQVQQNARQLQEGLQAQNDQLQSNFFELSSKLDESSDEQRLFAEQTTAHLNQLSAEFMQLSQNIPKQLDQATTQVNQALRAIDNNLSVSKRQTLTWLDDESQARKRFQDSLLGRLDQSQEIQLLTYLNSEKQLWIQEQIYKLQVLKVHNPGISVPQLTTGSAAPRLQFDISGQSERFLSSNNLARTLNAAAGGSSTESRRQMLELPDFPNDTDQSNFKKQANKLVSDAKIT